MKLLFKQRFFSWLDSYDIYDETGNTVFTVEGQLALSHTLHIMDTRGDHVGTVKQKFLTLLPVFEIYKRDEYIGCINREFTLFKPSYNIDYRGWNVQGNYMQWDYTVTDGVRTVATVNKELFKLTDTYTIDIPDPENALDALMLVLAIDADKCSRN